MRKIILSVIIGGLVFGGINSSGFYSSENKMNIKKTLERIGEFNDELKYPDFKYPSEINKILKHSKMTGVEPELMLAIRLSENGKDSIAYGVIPQGRQIEVYKNDQGYSNEGIFYAYEDEKEKQLRWAAISVKNCLDEFNKKPRKKDFISYLANRYAPIGAKTDPFRLNKYWHSDVKWYYKKFKKSKNIN